jgi:hypothetical protein
MTGPRRRRLGPGGEPAAGGITVSPAGMVPVGGRQVVRGSCWAVRAVRAGCGDL